MTQKTALYDSHKALGARFTEFAGWEMPVMYSGITAEHVAVREAAAIFDVSHMGEFLVKGPGAAGLLAGLIPTKLDRLAPGKTMYSAFCNEKGGVVDDLFIYMKGPEEYMLVVNAGTREKDFLWITDHMKAGVELVDLSAALSKIDLQGPKSADIATRVFKDTGVTGLKRFDFTVTGFHGREIMVSHTGYTGERGYEFYMPNDIAAELWDALLMEGADEGVLPAGLGARDTLRIEACYSLYGHELSDDITPVESGLKWIVSSEVPYIGRDVLERQISEKSGRRLIVFEMTERGVPREGYPVLRGGVEAGIVTSGTFSPTFQNGIGMALVAAGTVEPGDEIEILIRNKGVKGKTVPRPLYRYNGGRP